MSNHPESTDSANSQSVSRRHFLTTGAAGAGAAALVGTSAQDAEANAIKWDRTVDVVVIGAGVAGLPAAIAARDHGASVIIVDENYDIGGRGMLSGGRLHLGAGNAMQQTARHRGQRRQGVRGLGAP